MTEVRVPRGRSGRGQGAGPRPHRAKLWPFCRRVGANSGEGVAEMVFVIRAARSLRNDAMHRCDVPGIKTPQFGRDPRGTTGECGVTACALVLRWVETNVPLR